VINKIITKASPRQTTTKFSSPYWNKRHRELWSGEEEKEKQRGNCQTTYEFIRIFKEIYVYLLYVCTYIYSMNRQPIVVAIAWFMCGLIKTNNSYIKYMPTRVVENWISTVFSEKLPSVDSVSPFDYDFQSYDSHTQTSHHDMT